MSHKASVLFVDDEVHIVNLLKIMFRNDYEVFTATSGDAALEIVQARQIDVIVSDQRMPGMLGTELLGKVKARSPRTMRILLTGYSDLAAMVGSINEGEIYRFINKPWNNDEIRSIIREAAEAAVSTANSTVLAAPDALDESVGTGAGILILDRDVANNDWFKEHFRADYHAFTAHSIDEALHVLEQNDVGVVVTDTKVGGENTFEFLRILKQQYPQVMTVMLTAYADADAVMKLINQAQVCRLSFKPVKRGAIDLAIRAAMMHHRRYRTDPVLSLRQRVATSGEAESSLARSLATRLRGIARRFGFHRGA
ncbi:response regulator [Propionivibrio sp.]|uniref:response regulator n=1 Tax=Propionivibrio sp. TaxID=2212460 RepID=UPI0039E6B85B